MSQTKAHWVWRWLANPTRYFITYLVTLATFAVLAIVWVSYTPIWLRGVSIISVGLFGLALAAVGPMVHFLAVRKVNSHE